MSTAELRKGFHAELDSIRSDTIRLAARLVEMIPRGTSVLLDDDLEGAEYIINGDDAFDAAVEAIEARCYTVLALQQPMAVDLRRVIGVIKLLAEIERSADLVVNNCKAARRLHGTVLDPKLRGLIGAMGAKSHQLWAFLVEALATDNAGLASALHDMDDDLDRLHSDFIQAIFECHRADQMEVAAAVQLALVGRFYERLGDHAVNSGDRVRYMVTGDLPALPTRDIEADAEVPFDASETAGGS
jgi:phosphate transport system protein